MYKSWPPNLYKTPTPTKHVAREIVLRIANSKHDGDTDMDSGGRYSTRNNEKNNKGIASIHRPYYGNDAEAKKISEWDWSDGDTLELVNGKRKTHVKLDLYSHDEDRTDISLNPITRFNLGADAGDEITVRRVRPAKAQRIVLSPTKKVHAEDIKKYMDKHYENFVFTKDNIIPIMAWPEGRTWFVVQDTDPVGAVYSAESTEFVLYNKTNGQHAEKLTPDRAYNQIGGVEDQIRKIREMIELPMWHPEIFADLGIDAPKGLLLHGPPGTGKTLLASIIAEESNAHFTQLSGPEIMGSDYGESEKNLRRVFERAKREEPCIIFIDEIDSIVPKRDDVYGEVEKRVVAQLLTLMDGFNKRDRVVVIAATNRPDSIDPALRRPGRLDREIEIGIPNQEGRLAILEIHTKKMPLDSKVNLKLISKITHGYTGADIQQLCREAAMRSLRRAAPIVTTEQDGLVGEYLKHVRITWDDFKYALGETTPSAMRELVIQTPNVGWSHIGGLDSLKESLREFLEWPLKYGEEVKKFGVRIPKGILLHGPPGTGKTMIAKAIAKAGSTNFISIKGPELLSKWVGESEEGVREVFKKARQSAPCVVFFDEIDALVPRRGRDDGSYVTERVVSQILTEMDGLEDLQDVMVIGATNRPDMIDQAMLRPGRFDRIIEVPKPNEAERRHILEIHTKDKPVSPKIDLGKVVDATDGFSGADLESVASRAAMAALRRHIRGKKTGTGHKTARHRKNTDGLNDAAGSAITLEDLMDAATSVRREQVLRV